jgi:antitoxin ParD1/3/4
MSKVEKLSIALTPQLADQVRAGVESGDYATTSEMIRDGLRLLIERREGVRQLRAKIQKGLDSGPPSPREPLDDMLERLRTSRIPS